MSAYEDTLYDDFPFVTAHPAHVGAIAALFGVPAPDLDTVRMLDVGCALGGHLLPLAELHPDAEFVGIDLSTAQIAEARARADALGLSNVDLRVADLTTVDPASLGRFDVIVCHGVYAWVPREAQLALWTLIRRCLAPNGVAYVSTNVQPGWHLRGIVRGVLGRLVAPGLPDRERVHRAKVALEAWKATLEDRKGAWSEAVLAELRSLERTSDAYLLYEHLAAINEPVWFDHLAADAAAAGLQYLGDAVASDMFRPLPESASAWVDEGGGGDPIARETLTDLLTQRMFRRSLWVHREQLLDRELFGRRLEGLQVACPLASESPVALDDAPAVFSGPAGASVTVDDPLVKAALLELASAWPGGLPFEAVCAQARARLGGAARGADRNHIGRELLDAWSKGLCEIRTAYPAIAPVAGALPTATALARSQALRGDAGCVNLRHMRIALGHTERAVLARLDGAHDRKALAQALVADAEAGRVEVRRRGVPTTDPLVLRAVVEAVLQTLAGAGFLMG